MSPTPSPLHVPLLPLDTARLDADTLATWHLALCSAVGPDLPHDLLAIWLYTANGPVLLGPTALAADGLTPPRPVPHVSSADAEAFAGIFERARYADTLVQPVAYGRTDVALLVCASFAAPAQHAAKQELLLELAQRLAPMLARAARQWCDAEVGRVAESSQSVEALLTRLASAPSTDVSPAGMCHALFGAFGTAIPHDAAGLFVPGTSLDHWYGLHRQRDGVPWQSLACQVEEAAMERLVPLAQGGVTDVRAGTAAEWRALFPELESVPPSACAVRLVSGGRRVGVLVVASLDRDVYGARERQALALVAPYLAARVDALMAAQDAAAARARASALQVIPVQLGRLAALLGTRPDTAAAWRELVAESTTLLPLRQLRLAVRLGAHDRVAFVTPGETRPLADLPSTPIVGTPLAEILSGERPWVRVPEGELLDHAFPLRVGGELIGAMLVATAPDEPLSRGHMALAQQLADLVAPYVELQRRPYVRPPFSPGWKRTSPP